MTRSSAAHASRLAVKAASLVNCADAEETLVARRAIGSGFSPDPIHEVRARFHNDEGVMSQGAVLRSL
jgi:hypothetical protein